MLTELRASSVIELRHDWQLEEIAALFDKPFADLILQAQTIHRQHFKPNQIQLNTLMSIKTGACPEDCAYCPQSGHYATGAPKSRLSSIDDVIHHASIAKKNGATRFCMGAAWRQPHAKDLLQVIEMIKAVKALGMQTCVTLGMLDANQAQALKAAGLDYYNHNIDTSPDFYPKIISTRTFDDRLNTLSHVRNAKINVCCGGILGMGETREDRIAFLQQLANLPEHPQSVPFNGLLATPGTPLEHQERIDVFEFVRAVAVARILMPKSYVRLSAGRSYMSDEWQALCFLAGANSIHAGEKLFVHDNQSIDKDKQLFQSLGMSIET